MTRSKGLRGIRNDYQKDRNATIAKRVLNGETLQSVGDHYGITRERVRQISLKINGITKMVLNAQIKAEKDVDRINRESLVSMEIAWHNKLRCDLCGGWNIRAGRSAFKDGETAYKLCSSECSKHYLILRYRVDRANNDQNQATSILKRRENFDRATVKHAERIKAGTAGKHPEKYYVREGGNAARAVRYVRRQRKVLGTDHLFDDKIATLEIKEVKS